MQILTELGELSPWPEKMAFSPDGRYLAAGDSRGFHLWEPSAGANPLWSLRRNYISRDYCFALDGTAVLGGRADHYRYDIRTGKRSDHLLPDGIHPDQFSPDNRFAVAVYPDFQRGVLSLLCARADAGRWAEAWRKDLAFDPACDSRGYRAVFFSSDGGRLARIYDAGPSYRNVSHTGIEVFDSNTGERVLAWTGKLPLTAWWGVINPAGLVVLLRGSVFHIIDLNGSDSKHRKQRNASPKHFTSAAFSRDGTKFATTSNDTAATVWDTRTWELRKRYEWQIGRLRTVAFSPDGLRCAAGSDAGQIVVWDLDD
jgi:WD40 repeat protein